ncbi:MAG: type 4a pilus biogenesis protein PilO [Actinomycetota bacterium]
MSNTHRTIIIAALVVLIIAAFFILVRPGLQRNIDISNEIGEQKEENARLRERVAQLARVKDDFNILYARYQKYSIELPAETDIQILTSEIYNIGQFAGIELESINFNEITSDDDDEAGIIDINMVITGPYYNLLVFINTFESMSRITRLDSINLSVSAGGYPEMTAEIIGKTFYQVAE